MSSASVDPNPADNSVSVDTTVTAEADLAVTKVDDVDPVLAGDALSYTLTVSNAGPSDATDVVVTDTLPAGMTLVSTTGCTEDPNGVPICTLGTIAAGGSAQFTVSVTVDSSLTGTLTNTATASSSAADPNPADNSVSEDTAVNAEADLAITKVDDVDPNVPGGALAYTITVDNLGPSDATDVVVTDTLPAGVTLVSTSGCLEDPTGVPTCSLGTIVSGGSAQVTVNVTIGAGTTGVITNTATVATSTTDPVAVNDTVSEDTLVQFAPTAVDDAVAGGSSPGDDFHTPLNTSLIGTDGSSQDLDANDSLGQPTATIVSFGGGDLGGAVTDNAAGSTVTFGAGSLTVNGDGSFSFTPDTDATGPFSFDYRLENGAGSSDATVTLAVGVRPVANDDAFDSIGNVGLDAAGGTLGVDNGSGVDVGDEITVTSFDATSTQGGSVAANADGSFTYDPPAGFTGTDTFTYTVGNGFGDSAAATVTITVSEVIWFIDNGAAGSNVGTLSDPFQGISAFNASGGPSAGDNIFLAEGSGVYTSGIDLLNTQTLIGEGATGADLATLLGIVVPASSRALPAINGSSPVVTTTNAIGINLASGNTIRGLDVGNTGTGVALQDSGGTVGTLTVSEVSVAGTGGIVDITNGGTLTVTFDSLASTSSTNGIRLDGVGGSVAVTDLSISGATGTGIDIRNSSATFSFADISLSGGAGVRLDGNSGTFGVTGGTLSSSSGVAVDINGGTGDVNFGAVVTNPSGRSAEVTNRTGGTVTFSGAIDDDGAGIFLDNNSGSTIDFSGGLDLDTGGNDAFSATTGGAVNVTGTNTATTTTGVGVKIQNTTIGTSGVTFQSVSVNGAANGIMLDTAGSGGFTITGTGTTDASGGTIQNINNRGIEIVNTSTISLSNLALFNANTTDAGGAGVCDGITNAGCNAAVYLNGVTGVTLDNVDISGTTAEQGINGLNVSGLTLSDSTITSCGNAVNEGCLNIFNLAGTSSISNSDLSFAAERVAYINNSSGSLNLTVSGSTFRDTQSSGLGADGLEIEHAGSATSTIDIVNSNFLRNRTNGLQVLAQGNSVVGVDVTGSSFDVQGGIGIGMDLAASSSGQLTFNLIGNPTIVSNGSSAINVFVADTATMNGRINDNPNIQVGGPGTGGFGIRVANEGNASSTVEIDNNTIGNIGNDGGIQVLSRSGSGNVEATISDNAVTVGALSTYDIEVRAQNSNTLCANVATNTTSGIGIAAFRVRTSDAGATVELQGAGGSATAVWNGNGNTPLGSVSSSHVGTLTLGATCTSVSHPLP